MDGDRTGIDVQRGGLDALLTLCDGDGGTGGTGCADVQTVVALDAVVHGGDGDGATQDVQRLVAFESVVDVAADVQRDILDAEPGFSLRLGGRAALDAVFAIGPDVDGAGAADGDSGAVLGLDDRVLRVRVVRIALVVVVRAVAQVVDAARRRHDGDLGALVAGDRGRGAAAQAQAVQHEGDAGAAFLDFDGTVGAGAGDHIGAGAGDREGGALDLVCVGIPLRDGDAVVGEDEDGGPRGVIIRQRGHHAQAVQQRQRQQHRDPSLPFASFHVRILLCPGRIRPFFLYDCHSAREPCRLTCASRFGRPSCRRPRPSCRLRPSSDWGWRSRSGR